MRIMVVEDDQNDVIMIKRAFRKLTTDHQLVVRRHGGEALDYLDSLLSSEHLADKITPEIILLDINMPCLGGHGFLKKLRVRAEYSTIPVVILTTSKRDKDVVSAYQAGANSYLVKPIAFDEFLAKITLLVDYWSINEVISKVTIE